MKTYRLISRLFCLAWLAQGLACAQQTAADFFKQGQTKMSQSDFEGAIGAFDQAITLNPKSVQNFNERGFARFHKGDISGAMADFNQALTLDAKFSNSYYGRALVEQVQDNLDKALADYRNVIALSTGPSDNPHFYLWLVRAQLNQIEGANSELSDYLAKLPDHHDWSKKMGGFLTGQVTEADLTDSAAAMTTAEGRSKARCEAWYFVGMKYLMAGDMGAATENFKKCVSTSELRLTQYPLAQAELKALALNPGH